MFWVISVYFNLRNILPKSGTFLPGHPVERNKRMEEKLKIKEYNKLQIKTKEVGTSAKGTNCTMLIPSHQLLRWITVQIFLFSKWDYATWVQRRDDATTFTALASRHSVRRNRNWNVSATLYKTDERQPKTARYLKVGVCAA